MFIRLFFIILKQIGLCNNKQKHLFYILSTNAITNQKFSMSPKISNRLSFVILSEGRQTVIRERNEKLYNGVNVGQQTKKPNKLLKRVIRTKKRLYHVNLLNY